MGLEVRASLIVAAAELKLVRLLRDAIRTADLAGGKNGPPGSLAPQPGPLLRPDRVIDPAPRIAPRVTIHPTPRFEARPVVRTRLETDSFERAACATVCDAKSTSLVTPLPAPWKTPAWKNAIAPAPVVKIYIHRVDVQNKGSLLDFFL